MKCTNWQTETAGDSSAKDGPQVCKLLEEDEEEKEEEETGGGGGGGVEWLIDWLIDDDEEKEGNFHISFVNFQLFLLHTSYGPF